MADQYNPLSGLKATPAKPAPAQKVTLAEAKALGFDFAYCYNFDMILEDDITTILKLAIPYSTTTVFSGECKSINNLKTIMRFLNIK